MKRRKVWAQLPKPIINSYLNVLHYQLRKLLERHNSQGTQSRRNCEPGNRRCSRGLASAKLLSQEQFVHVLLEKNGGDRGRHLCFSYLSLFALLTPSCWLVYKEKKLELIQSTSNGEDKWRECYWNAI